MHPPQMLIFRLKNVWTPTPDTNYADYWYFHIQISLIRLLYLFMNAGRPYDTKFIIFRTIGRWSLSWIWKLSYLQNVTLTRIEYCIFSSSFLLRSSYNGPQLNIINAIAATFSTTGQVCVFLFYEWLLRKSWRSKVRWTEAVKLKMAGMALDI